jgi:glutaredoxin-like protein NrdH
MATPGFDVSSPERPKMVTVYTLPACVQCESTKKFLTKNDVPFETVDLSQDEKAMDLVKTLGYQAAPVVVAGDSHWSGFRPDKLNALTA